MSGCHPRRALPFGTIRLETLSDMKKKLNQIVRWVSTKRMVWLVFGAKTFIFMSCYVPVPTEYNEADFAGEVVDSTDITRSGDVAEEEIASDSLYTEDQV